MAWLGMLFILFFSRPRYILSSLHFTEKRAETRKKDSVCWISLIPARLKGEEEDGRVWKKLFSSLFFVLRMCLRRRKGNLQKDFARGKETERRKVEAAITNI